MSDDALFRLVLGGLAVSGFVATAARALREFSRHELRELCQRRKSLDLFGEILRRHRPVARGTEIFSVLVTTVVVVAATLWLSHRWAAGAENWPEFALRVVGLGLAVSVANLFIPWGVVAIWAEPFLHATWRLWIGVELVMRPLVFCGGLFDEFLHRLAGREREDPSEETLEEEIRTIVTEGHREGLLEEEAREMIEGVMELADVQVSEIMTPRTDMQMVRASLPWNDLVQSVIESRHTRVPVFDKNRDDVIGILHSKDLLPELAERNGQPASPLGQILRKPYFVPETKAVNDLLREFQRTGNHIAVVLDEYGGVSGLVTIEDVLEEIVGDIVDEHDEGIVEEIHAIDARTCEALGRAHVDEINERMGTELPEDSDFDTIGGFVFSELGHIPASGESMEWQDQIRITVLDVSRRRIDRVRIEILDRETPPSE